MRKAETDTIMKGPPRLTPERRIERDCQDAQMFRDLESAVSDIHNGACLMEIAADNTVFTNGKNWLTDKIREQNGGLDGYVVYVLTETQANAIVYAIYHSLPGSRGRAWARQPRTENAQGK